MAGRWTRIEKWRRTNDEGGEHEVEERALRIGGEKEGEGEGVVGRNMG